MTTAQTEFALCNANTGYEDLAVWKVYRLLPGLKAAEVACLRVIDESGADYLYPASRFVQVTFPADVRETPLASVTTSVQGWVNHVRYGNTVGLRKAVSGRLPPEP